MYSIVFVILVYEIRKPHDQTKQLKFYSNCLKKQNNVTNTYASNININIYGNKR